MTIAHQPQQIEKWRDGKRDITPSYYAAAAGEEEDDVEALVMRTIGPRLDRDVEDDNGVGGGGGGGRREGDDDEGGGGGGGGRGRRRRRRRRRRGARTTTTALPLRSGGDGAWYDDDRPRGTPTTRSTGSGIPSIRRRAQRRARGERRTSDARGENTAPRPLTLLLVFFLTPTPKQKCPGYEPKLEKILRHSKCCKGRLLHYFPAEEDDRHSAAATDDDDDRANNNNGARDDAQFSDWCGWHNDHGSLTGLLPALYLDGDGNIVDSPDVEAGLYIKARDGTLVHAKIPENAVAYQVGETAQIHTGGLLKATPRGEYIHVYISVLLRR